MPGAAKFPNEHIIATRMLDAPVHAIVDVLRDPTRHRDTEPTHWVGDAIDPALITDTGQQMTR